MSSTRSRVAETQCPGLLGTLALLVLAAGCASIKPGPAPEMPVETPRAWTAEGRQPGAAATETPAEWWRDFGSVELDQLVDSVLRNNPSLQAAASNLEAAMAQARIEGAPLLPQVSAGLNGARRKQNFVGFPIPGSEGGVLSTTSSNYGLSLNVSWEADLWGRLRSLQKAALADVAATAGDLEAARLSLAGQAVKGWLAVIEAGQQVALSERTLESRRASERRVMARYRRGLVPSLDVRLAGSQAESVAAQLAQRRQLFDALARQLEVLAGSYPAAQLAVATELPETPAPLALGVPADTLARRPDLRAAEQRALASSARLAAARRALYPSLSLTGSTGTVSDGLADLVDGDFSVWSLASSLLQPLFQGGRLRAGVDLRQAGLDATEAIWLETALRAFLEVETAIEAERFLDDQVGALEQSARHSRAAEQLALDRYYRGLADFLGVLESQRTAFVSESQLLAARRERLAARVDLVLALGGGASPPRADSMSASRNLDGPVGSPEPRNNKP